MAPSSTTNMPLNPRLFVWFLNLRPDSIRLISGSEEIPIAIERAQTGGPALWVRPLATLRPSTEYTVMGSVFEAASLEMQVSSFTTTAQSGALGLDTTPPSVSEAALTPGGLADHCGVVGAAATLTFTSVSDDFAGSDVIVQVDAEDGSRAPAFLLKSVGPYQQAFAVAKDAEAARCLNFKAFGTGAETTLPDKVRLTVWDWAGNSRVIEGQELRPAPAPTEDDTGSMKKAGGCSFAHDRPAWPLLTLPFAWLFAAARRRGTRDSRVVPL